MKNKEQSQGLRLGWLKNGNPPFNLKSLPRCNAKAKSTGVQCRQAAMKNGKCYLHGGKNPGAPKGNQNAYKHGYFGAEAIAERRLIRQLISDSKEFIERI